MIKIIALIFLFSITSNIVFSQNVVGKKHIYEIKKELINSKADTNRVLLFIELCTAYQWRNSDSLELYSRKGIELSKQLNFSRGEARILCNQGVSLLFGGNIPKAMDISFRALRIAERNKYPLETAISLNNIGGCYSFLNDNSKAIDFINRARSIIEPMLVEQYDVYWKIYIEFWSAATYSDMNKLDSAEYFFQKAYTDAFDSTFTDLYNIRPTILIFYGKFHFRKGNYQIALRYLRKGIEEYNASSDLIGLSDAFTNIAYVFEKMNQPDSVIYYAKRGLDASLASNYNFAIINNTRLLVAEYEKKDIYQAHSYLKLLLAANDSLYGAKKIQDLQKTLSEEQLLQQQINQEQIDRENRLKQYGLIAGLGALLIIAFILFRNNRQKNKANKVLEKTLTDLKSTQTQLIQSEKMASLGELTAGIAHEIQNPLNFVNNFSEVSNELIDEMNVELDKGDINEAKIISSDIKQNLEKINHHGKRADAIVKGMLQHSRSSSGVKEPTDINALCDEYLRLSYHGLRAKDKSFNATMKTDYDEGLQKVNVIPQDIGRVILNLITNAFYAVSTKALASVDSDSSFAKASEDKYEPTVSIKTTSIRPPSGSRSIQIKVSDNGGGIPEKVLYKIFQPFFTTKPTGQGTGLGLSMSYDIITKGHGGELRVETKEGQGSEFIISIPVD